MFQAKPASRNTHYRAISVVPIAEVLRAKISLPSGIGVRKLLGFIHSFSFRIVLIRRYLAVSMEEAMSATVQSFVDEIAAKANVDPGAAETAVGTILFVIQREGNATKVEELFDQLPGASDLAQKHQVVAGSGGGLLGTLSGVADKVVGGDAGMLVAAVAQIEATNLTVPQIKNIGTALVAYLKENANPEVVTEIVNGIPGLKDHLTHHV
jgi:hypothetical protein